jgi:hypothetical protein
MFKEYQEVQLNMDRLVDNELYDTPVILRRGQRGIIVLVHDIPGLPIGYSVEFFDENGDTLAVPALEEKYLTPIGEPPLPPSGNKRAVA